MGEAADNNKTQLKEIKAIAEEKISEDEKCLEEITAIEHQRNLNQIRLESLIKFRYGILKLLKIKRRNAAKQFEESIKEMKTLDDEIAGIGLNHCLKIVQLKIRYEIEVDDLIRTHQETILAMIRAELMVKELLKEAKSLRRWCRKVKRQVEELEKRVKKRLEDYRKVVNDIEMLEKRISKVEKEKELREIETLRRKAKLDRVERYFIIVAYAVHFVIFIYLLVDLYWS